MGAFAQKNAQSCAGNAFLGATKHLYNWLCPSVCWLVCWSGNAFVRRSTRRTLLAYLAFFLFIYFFPKKLAVSVGLLFGLLVG